MAAVTDAASSLHRVIWEPSSCGATSSRHEASTPTILGDVRAHRVDTLGRGGGSRANDMRRKDENQRQHERQADSRGTEARGWLRGKPSGDPTIRGPQ